jgi:hypothetical protein
MTPAGISEPGPVASKGILSLENYTSEVISRSEDHRPDVDQALYFLAALVLDQLQFDHRHPQAAIGQLVGAELTRRARLMTITS